MQMLRQLFLLKNVIVPLILLLCFSHVEANTHKPQVFLNNISGSKQEGKQIYSHFCKNCHAKNPVIPLGAPRFRQKQDWNLRVKQGLERLFHNTDQGLNAMPPRGGCFECTDRQLLLALIFMLPQKAKEAILNQINEDKKIKM